MHTPPGTISALLLASSLLCACGAPPDDGVGARRQRLAGTAAAAEAECQPKTRQVLYLGPCVIPPGGTYQLPDTGEECKVVSATNTFFQGSPACLEIASCKPCASLPFSQAPGQGTAAAESANPNMIGD